MNGLEKITGRIQSDAQAQVQDILTQAKAQAQTIAQDYDRQAQEAKAALASQGKLQAQQRAERLESAAQLEGRNLMLAQKQQLLTAAFDRALENLRGLDKAAYTALLTRLLVQASVTGQEEVIMNAADRAQVGKEVVTAANEQLAKAVSPKLPERLRENKVGALVDKVVSGVSAVAHGTGLLTLAPETRDIRGGFILKDGLVEVNCALETLVGEQRDALTAQVADVLFPQAAS